LAAKKKSKPSTFHLDKRATALARTTSDEDEDRPMATDAAAAWLGMSKAWLEQGRHRGYGPEYIRYGRTVRYTIRLLKRFCTERVHYHTAEYMAKKKVKR